MDLSARVEGLFAEFERQRSSLNEAQEKMREVSETATSPRREVSVTVGQNGTLTGIQFPTSAFRRMTPGELSTALMTTYAEAKEKALTRSAEILQPLMPEGADAATLMRGATASETYMPDAASLPAELRDMFGIERPHR
ncbi:YbaB/EbfC family nucleoid-associated protein [Actinoplanes sp. TRM 88003]|uniref:YbaB/EbfC family nucleoid-associated protein n=1 Tax=Paractinoplanes aksuensis TaxID=2939490 RepID=A0ABT1DX78_9ACTN|nr:YbaB/EbfC family nucleoid-associated protein [Actinoplanes aksuensis]MCO8275487.1 YbaB/EbfC family nucleoid-associated protein [Actinoplanes aksuensis]